MQTKRLNAIIKRQKRYLKLDVLLAVMFVIGLGLATVAFVTTVPSLAPRSVDEQSQAQLTTDQSPAQITASILDSRPTLLVQ